MYADFLEAEPRDLERRHAHSTLEALGRALRRVTGSSSQIFDIAI
jgi:hypothetical protein